MFNMAPSRSYCQEASLVRHLAFQTHFSDPRKRQAWFPSFCLFSLFLHFAMSSHLKFVHLHALTRLFFFFFKSSDIEKSHNWRKGINVHVLFQHLLPLFCVWIFIAAVVFSVKVCIRLEFSWKSSNKKTAMDFEIYTRRFSSFANLHFTVQEVISVGQLWNEQSFWRFFTHFTKARNFSNEHCLLSYAF